MTLCFGMRLTVQEESQNFPISFELLKCYLRINHNDHDDLLKEMIAMAKASVEQETETALLEKTLEVEHNNTHVFLPYKPVQKVLEVFLNDKKLEEDQFAVEVNGNQYHVLITPKPFTRMPRTKRLRVRYVVGYGSEAKDVPSALREAVLREVKDLYNALDSGPIGPSKTNTATHSWRHSQHHWSVS
jgi:uncharacterized phiE125 gp8 family phage protein